MYADVTIACFDPLWYDREPQLYGGATAGNWVQVDTGGDWAASYSSFGYFLTTVRGEAPSGDRVAGASKQRTEYLYYMVVILPGVLIPCAALLGSRRVPRLVLGIWIGVHAAAHVQPLDHDSAGEARIVRRPPHEHGWGGSG